MPNLLLTSGVACVTTLAVTTLGVFLLVLRASCQGVKTSRVGYPTHVFARKALLLPASAAVEEEEDLADDYYESDVGSSRSAHFRSAEKSSETPAEDPTDEDMNTRKKGWFDMLFSNQESNSDTNSNSPYYTGGSSNNFGSNIYNLPGYGYPGAYRPHRPPQEDNPVYVINVPVENKPHSHHHHSVYAPNYPVYIPMPPPRPQYHYPPPRPPMEYYKPPPPLPPPHIHYNTPQYHYHIAPPHVHKQQAPPRPPPYHHHHPSVLTVVEDAYDDNYNDQYRDPQHHHYASAYPNYLPINTVVNVNPNAPPQRRPTPVEPHFHHYHYAPEYVNYGSVNNPWPPYGSNYYKHTDHSHSHKPYYYRPVYKPYWYKPYKKGPYYAGGYDGYNGGYYGGGGLNYGGQGYGDGYYGGYGEYGYGNRVKTSENKPKGDKSTKETDVPGTLKRSGSVEKVRESQDFFIYKILDRQG